MPPIKDEREEGHRKTNKVDLTTKPRFNHPIEPMDLANMRHDGVKSLNVQYERCRHNDPPSVDAIDRLGP
jgi:hypothetical protein